MISWKISRDFALRARLRWLRYAIYFLATSLRGLFMSSNSTWSWIASTLMFSTSIFEIAAAISAARTISSPSSVTPIALRMASTIFLLSNITTLPSRFTTYFTIELKIVPHPLYKSMKQVFYYLMKINLVRRPKARMTKII